MYSRRRSFEILPPVATARLLGLGLTLIATTLVTRSARADVIFSNFNNSTVWAFGTGVPVNQPVTEWEQAMQFRATITATVNTIVVPVFTEGSGGLPKPPPGTFFGNSMQVALYADNSGQPGTLLELIDMPDSVPLWDSWTPPMPPPLVVTLSGKTQVQAGQFYWVSLIETESTFLFWTFSHSMPHQSRLNRIVGTDEWQSAGLFTQAGLQVHGTPIPGSASAAGLVCLLMAGSRRR